MKINFSQTNLLTRKLAGVGSMEDIMGVFYYEVVSIDGDYANLKRTDLESGELKLVARALLPPEIAEGTKLKYEWMQYEIISGEC